VRLFRRQINRRNFNPSSFFHHGPVGSRCSELGRSELGCSELRRSGPGSSALGSAGLGTSELGCSLAGEL
jgi:hypothetical protein